MDRASFLKLCTVLGVGLPLISSCEKSLVNITGFKGKVLIIGAGAGGLSAGYLLNQLGVEFEILEASSVIGGRIKSEYSFADFPIPLGAEWIETKKSVFEEMVNDKSVQIDFESIRDGEDFKFINYSWFNFFEDFIYPSVKDKIRFNHQVNSIDYSGNQILVSGSGGDYHADKVIVSVPLKILQMGLISFMPTLPAPKKDAIQKAVIWDGFKAFFEFSDHFYGEGHEYTIIPKEDGQKIYYNASYGQNSTQNILGVFAVGEPAKVLSLLSSEELKNYVLKDLDQLFQNKANSSYIKHISQSWQAEPHIQAGYLSDYEDWRLVRELGKSVDSKIFFAGGEYTDGEDWVSVHTATQSARNAVEEMLS